MFVVVFEVVFVVYVENKSVRKLIKSCWVKLKTYYLKSITEERNEEHKKIRTISKTELFFERMSGILSCYMK